MLAPGRAKHYGGGVFWRRHPKRVVIHHYLHVSPDLKQLLKTLVHQGDAIMADLSTLTAAVERETSVTSSAVTLLNQISAQLRDAATDQAAVNALADQLEAQASTLADAVTANTTDAPQPVSEPQPVEAPPEPSTAPPTSDQPPTDAPIQ